MSRICPPSSRVSPFCHSAEPCGQGHTRLSHIMRRRLIMPLVALVQKKQSAPATAYKFWCSALPSSSPLLLAFRHATSKCLYKNATNRHSAKKSTPSGVFFVYYLYAEFAYILVKNAIFGWMTRKKNSQGS